MVFFQPRKTSFFVYLFLFSFAASSAQTSLNKKGSDTALHLFVIGNSFSGNATKYLPQLAKEGGHKLIIGRAELGGCTIQTHWESVEASADTTNPKGKPYKGKSLRALLSAGTWDVVTIQQYSLVSGDVSTYRPYAKKLYDFIRSLQPKAKIVIHQTWAYRADAGDFGKIKGNTTAKSQQEMYEMSKHAYQTIAGELGIEIIPTGDAFFMADTDYLHKYKRDSTFDFSNPVYPKLPRQTNSLHVGYSWNKDNKFTFDSHHANDAGCYLGALVWYQFLFGQQATTLHFKPAEVDQLFADYLKEVAGKVINTKRNRKDGYQHKTALLLDKHLNINH